MDQANNSSTFTHLSCWIGFCCFCSCFSCCICFEPFLSFAFLASFLLSFCAPADYRRRNETLTHTSMATLSHVLKKEQSLPRRNFAQKLEQKGVLEVLCRQCAILVLVGTHSNDLHAELTFFFVLVFVLFFYFLHFVLKTPGKQINAISGRVFVCSRKSKRSVAMITCVSARCACLLSENSEFT